MSITWNGVSSDTIGVIVERIPNRYVPTRRFSPQQVAGRNGNILLVDKSFPNVEQEYEVYLSAEAQGLPSVARACAEWLMGPDGYCRLEDSYDTTVYREAFLMGGYDLENILNKFGRCTITFSCKPQKYLLTGDTPIEIPAGITTYTGDVVQFDGVTGASITSLSTTITPTQDLHGYASPWPAGGGKNKLPSPTNETKSANGVTVKCENGVYTFTGTATEYTTILFSLPVSVDLSPSTNKIAFLNSKSSGNLVVDMMRDSTKVHYWSMSPANRVASGWTDSGNEVINGIKFEISNGIETNMTISPMLIATSESNPSTFVPWANICPISGRTGLSVYRTGKNLFDESHFLECYGWTSTNGVYSGSNVQLHVNFNNGFPGIAFKENTQYTFFATFKSAEAKITVFGFNYADGTSTVIYPQNTSDEVITITSTAGKTVKNFKISYGGATTVYISGAQLAEGSIASDFVPYQGQAIPITFPSEAGTVYGGTLDVVTGVLTVDRANIASYNGEVINEPWLSSMDAYVEGATPTTGSQVVYTLATPLTYQLTPQEIEALVGENNVWTSSGPVSVTVEAPFVGTVTNPTPFEARPMLEVSGVGEITINGKTIQILEAVSDFNIDCESMEAEDNSKIYCIDFPELSGGENEIAGDGSITALTVTPRWWTL